MIFLTVESETFVKSKRSFSLEIFLFVAETAQLDKQALYGFFFLGFFWIPEAF